MQFRRCTAYHLSLVEARHNSPLGSTANANDMDAFTLQISCCCHCRGVTYMNPSLKHVVLSSTLAWKPSQYLS